MNSLLISQASPNDHPLAIPVGARADNTGRVMTKRIPPRERSTVILSFKAVEANAMRAFIKSIRIKGDKEPSQSLVARRALQVYLHRLEMLRREAPPAYSDEIAALERMVTPVPQPAREDQLKKPR